MTGRHHGFGRFVGGVILLAVGFLFLLDNLDLIDAGNFFRLWPLILIAFGISKAMEPARRGIGLFLILFGLWFLLSNFDIITRDPWDLWPIILILLGGSLVWQAIGSDRSASTGAGQSGFVSASAILGGSHHQVSSHDFRGGDLTALLGGCEIDLRQAVPVPEGAVLEVFALWGGIEIRVPEDWKVELRGRPILGGFADSRRGLSPDPKHTLIVQGTAVMGGVEISS